MPISPGRVDLFCLFVACSHTLMEATVLTYCFIGCGPECRKCSEITNCQYLWKGLSDLVDSLHVVICIKISIEAAKICLFSLAFSGIGSQPIILSDVLNFRNLKNI